MSTIPTPGDNPALAGQTLTRDATRELLGQVMGLGWMLEVAPHPQFEKNGWIYIQHTDRCSDCNALSRKSKRPVSMNRLIRGRIRDGDLLRVAFEDGEIANLTSGETLQCDPIPAHLMEMVRDGGLLAHLEKRLGRVR